jgi:lipopolysaccharide transport system ATP-binding protein
MKSYNKMAELMNKTAVILVSHSMPDVARSCDKALFMSHGVIQYYGNDIAHAIQSYFRAFNTETFRIEYNEGADIIDLKVNSQPNKPDSPIKLNYRDNLILDFSLQFKKNVTDFFVMVQITDKDLKIVGQYFSNKFQKCFSGLEAPIVRVLISELLFIDGEYSITYFIMEEVDQKYVIMATYRYFTKIIMQGLNDNIYASVYLNGISYQSGNELPYKN